MNSMDRANLASMFGEKKGGKVKADTPEARNARIELYASRVAANCDIWTGESRGNASDKPEVEIDETA